MTDRLRKELEGECDPNDITGEPGDPELTDESADSATVRLPVADGDRETTLQLTVVDDGGEWLIDEIGAVGGTPGADPPTSESGGITDELSTGTVEETAASFVEALRARDCVAIDHLSTERRLGTIACQQLVARIGPDWEVGDPQITSEGGDYASVTVMFDADGIEVPIAVDILDQRGTWLIDNIDITNLL